MMRISAAVSICVALLCLSGVSALGEDSATLQKTLNDAEVQGAWIYNDLNAGISESNKTGKPLLVVFRCVR